MASEILATENMKKINIGLTGLGRIGKVHLENLVFRMPQVNVVAVSDVLPDTHGFARDLGIVNIYDHFSTVLQHEEIEAMVICSPTNTHLEYIELSAKAGKHIFCEKPLDMTIEKIQAINQVVQENHVKLQVGFNRRFDRNFARIRKSVESGSIGDPHILKITSRDPAPPPVEYLMGSGGLFLDMTIHDFDMSRFIMGSEVTEVYAYGASLVDPAIGEIGDIDTAIIILKFENGAAATIDNSRKAVYGYDQRVEVFGAKGMANIANHHEDTHEFFDGSGGHRPRLLHFFMDRYTESYYNEMKDFIEAIQENKKVPVDGHDALMATTIALAAKKSMLENRPVKLKELLGG